MRQAATGLRELRTRQARWVAHLGVLGVRQLVRCPTSQERQTSVYPRQHDKSTAPTASDPTTAGGGDRGLPDRLGLPDGELREVLSN
jgi:hypothetical protein